MIQTIITFGFEGVEVSSVDRVRLFRAQYQDIVVANRLGHGQYRVNGNRDIEYTVDLGSPSCTCPDWQDRRPTGGCKHILTVKLKRGEIDPLAYKSGNKSASPSEYPDNWDKLRNRTLERDQHECQRCGRSGVPDGTAQLHVHHIEQKAQGGRDRVSNLITLCRDCHESIHGHNIPATPTSDPNVSRYNHQPDRKNNDTEGRNHAERRDTIQSENAYSESTPLNSHKHESAYIDRHSSDSSRNAGEDPILFSGKVVCTGDPVVLDDGANAIGVETDESFHINDTIAVRGPVRDGRIIANDVFDKFYQFTGVVIQTGDPASIRDGSDKIKVETDKSLQQGDKVTVRGPIRDGRLVAEQLYTRHHKFSGTVVKTDGLVVLNCGEEQITMKTSEPIEHNERVTVSGPIRGDHLIVQKIDRSPEPEDTDFSSPISEEPGSKTDKTEDCMYTYHRVADEY